MAVAASQNVARHINLFGLLAARHGPMHTPIVLLRCLDLHAVKEVSELGRCRDRNGVGALELLPPHPGGAAFDAVLGCWEYLQPALPPQRICRTPGTLPADRHAAYQTIGSDCQCGTDLRLVLSSRGTVHATDQKRRFPARQMKTLRSSATWGLLGLGRSLARVQVPAWHFKGLRLVLRRGSG